MDATGILALQAAIRIAHGVSSTWLRAERVREVFGDVLVWDGDVEVFELEDGAGGRLAYAWTTVGPRSRRAMIVLGEASIRDAAAAVRAMMGGAAAAITLPAMPAVDPRPLADAAGGDDDE